MSVVVRFYTPKKLAATLAGETLERNFLWTQLLLGNFIRTALCRTPLGVSAELEFSRKVINCHCQWTIVEFPTKIGKVGRSHIELFSLIESALLIVVHSFKGFDIFLCVYEKFAITINQS